MGLTTEHYNSLIGVFCKNARSLSDIHRAESYFGDMQRDRVLPDETSYVMLIHAATKVDPNTATRYFQSMKEARFAPDVKVYNSFLASFSRKNDLKKVNEWMDKISDDGLEPTLVSHNCFISALAKAGKYQTMLTLIENHMDVANAQTYNKLLDCLVRADKFELALEKFHAMLSKQLKHTDVAADLCSFSTILAAFAARGDIDNVNLYLDKLEECGLVADRQIWNIVMNAYSRRGDLNQALEVFGKIEMLGLQPDVVSFGQIISAFAKQGAVSEVEAWYEKMMSRNIQGDAFVYRSIVDCFAKVNNPTRAEFYFNKMVAARIAPNGIVASSLVHSYSKNGNVAAAEQCIFRLRNDFGVEVKDPVMTKTMLHGCHSPHSFAP